MLSWKKLAGKSNCIRPEIEIKLSLYGCNSSSEIASVNHTGEIWAIKIVFSHDTCHAAEQGNSDSQNRPIWGCLAQFLKEGILLTSWYFMVVVRKGKISSVHTVALNCTQWKRQYEGCRLYWESVQLLTALAAGSLGFSRFGKIGQPHPSKLVSLMFFSRFSNFWKITNEGSH